jgi:uncharacterized protein (TIGR02996 family)
MCTRSLQIAGALMVERFCQRYEISHPALWAWIDQLWQIGTTNDLPAWHRKDAIDPLDEGVLCACPAAFKETLRALITVVDEIGITDLYGATTNEPRALARQARQIVELYGIKTTDLTPLSWGLANKLGYGDPIASTQFDSWRALRKPLTLELAVRDNAIDHDSAHDRRAAKGQTTTQHYRHFFAVAAIASERELQEHALVLADWLQERGDPRGELIKQDKRLHASVDKLLRQQADRLLPEGLRARDVRWKNGFVHGLTLDGRRVLDLDRYLRHPSLGALRELTLCGPAVTALPELPASLRCLRLLASHTLEAELVVAWAPQLQWLEIAGGISLADLQHPDLSRLTVRATTRSGLAQQGSWSLPALQRLDVDGSFVEPVWEQLFRGGLLSTISELHASRLTLQSCYARALARPPARPEATRDHAHRRPLQAAERRRNGAAESQHLLSL